MTQTHEGMTLDAHNSLTDQVSTTTQLSLLSELFVQDDIRQEGIFLQSHTYIPDDDQKPAGLLGIHMIPHWSECGSSYGEVLKMVFLQVIDRFNARITSEISRAFDVKYLQETEEKKVFMKHFQTKLNSQENIKNSV